MDPITPELEGTLRRFTDLLTDRAVPYGFIAERDAGRIWERHVLDSMRVVPLIPRTALDALDIGSGAGLPGIVVAAARPDLRVVLLEAQRKRVAFLEYAAHQLALSNVRVVHGRAEDEAVEADVAFGRAVGSAPAVWRLARRHLRPGGMLLYFAGESWSVQDQQGLPDARVEPRDLGASVDVGAIVMISARGGSGRS
jgi:16S rRNA (guanine527-N7)-methyltransferase